MAISNESVGQALLLADPSIDVDWPDDGQDGASNGGWVAPIDDGGWAAGDPGDQWSAQAGAAGNHAEWIDQPLGGPDSVEAAVFIVSNGDETIF